MSELGKHKTGLVETGCFYFKDSARYHYAIKKSVLLEDIKAYQFPLPQNIKEITTVDVVIDNAIADNFQYLFGTLSWGAIYGAEWYGHVNAHSNVVSIILHDYSDNPLPVLGPADRISYKADVWVNDPVRNLLSKNESTQEIEISFTGSEGTANCFGLNGDHTPDKVYKVEIYQQSPLDSEGELIDFDIHKYNGGSDISQNFSLETSRDSTPISLADVQSVQSVANPIPITTPDSDLLEYLRPDDIMWLEYRINVIPIKNTADLPPINLITYGTVFKITNPLDVNFDKYYVLNSLGTLVLKTSIPRQNNSKFRVILQEVPSEPGKIHQSQVIFVKPVDFDAADWFDAPRVETELPQALMSFFDGIPPSTRIYTNRTTLLIDDLVSNTLKAKQNTVPDKTIDIEYVFHIDGKQKFYDAGIKLNSSPKVKLIGRGLDFVEDQKIFFWQMKPIFILPDDYQSTKAPVVITDFLASDIDIKETTNTEFTLNGRQVIVNRADNKIVNPTFLRASNEFVPPYDLYNCIREKDNDKANSILHEYSMCLSGEKAYLRQHVPGINPDNNYVFSVFAKSLTGSLKAAVYEFSNKGAPLCVSPDIRVSSNEAIQDNDWYSGSEVYIPISNERYLVSNEFIEYKKTLIYGAKEMPAEFEKIVARQSRFTDFNKSDHLELETVYSEESLSNETTDIVVELENNTSGSKIYVDALQLEVGNNPSEFSHSYDYGSVEYETSDKPYAPRFLISSLDNRLNRGFLVLHIDEASDIAAMTPQEATVFSNRHRTLNYLNTHTWSKMYGKDKWRHVGSFSKHRTEHLGEYFLYPDTLKVRYLNFIPEPMAVQQKTILNEGHKSNLYILAENEEFKNIAGLPIKVSLAFTEGVPRDEVTVITEDDGSASFPIPDIYAEAISPLTLMGINDTQDYNLGYSITTGVVDVHVPVLEELYCIMTESGKASGVMAWNGYLYAGAVVNGEQIPIENVYTPGEEQEYYVPLVNQPGIPVGFIEWPLELLFDATVNNNASTMFSFLSGLNNAENPISIYSRKNPIEITLPRTGNNDYSEFQVALDSFNPIETSIVLKNPNDDIQVYALSRTDKLSKNQFIFDRNSSKLFVNDPNLDSVNVTYLSHLVFIDPDNKKKIYFHRSILFKIMADLYNQIHTTSLEDQHEQDFPPALGSIPPFKPLDFPLFIRASYNAIIYVKAQSSIRLANSQITYVHNKALI